MAGVMDSEPHVEVEEERTARRERREVDEAANGLVAEVVHFRIGAPVVRLREQVTAREADANVTRAAAEQALSHLLRERVGERELAQLDERTILYVGRRDTAVEQRAAII